VLANATGNFGAVLVAPGVPLKARKLQRRMLGLILQGVHLACLFIFNSKKKSA